MRFSGDNGDTSERLAAERRLRSDLTGHDADPVPDDGLEAAVDVIRSTRLFRYLCDRPEDSEVSLLERDITRRIGAGGAVATNSCTSALFLALCALGVQPGADVLMPAITFTAVPSAVIQAGARPVLVECKDDMTIDEADLETRILPATGAVLVSHMRGRVCDLDRVAAACSAARVPLVEDCAHSLGVSWSGRPTGSFGAVGCFSFQSRKIVNAGEGGVLVSRDAHLLARATVMSGAFEQNWELHDVDPALATRYAGTLPNYSLRMSNVTAAIARRQLPHIAAKARIYRRNYAHLAAVLAGSRIVPVREDPRAQRAPDTMQFRISDADDRELRRFCESARVEGLPVTAFGLDPGNARCFWNWRYLDAIPHLPRSRSILHETLEVRLPVWLRPGHVTRLGEALIAVLDRVHRDCSPAPVGIAHA